MPKITVITNNQVRDLIEGYELSPREQSKFDYLDWKKIEAGEDFAQFFRYKGTLYDLGEFVRLPAFRSQQLKDWDGYQSDTFFSGILVKLNPEGDGIIVGRYYDG